MRSSDAYARLLKLGVPVIETSDAAAALQQTTGAAAKMLSRLAAARLVSLVRHGTWWLDGAIDPYLLPQHLTAPFPSYVSLHTALHVHGLIEQIPEMFYAASLARTQRIETSAATFSIHHLAPEVFGGYEETASGVWLATAEKALFDFAYLSGGRSRLFSALPEMELPARFHRAELERWVQRIPSERSRTITTRKLEQFLAGASRASSVRSRKPKGRAHGKRPR